MSVIYTAQGFRLTQAKPGTAQSKSRPVTAQGSGETVRISLTDAQHAAYMAEADPAKRAAILAKIETRRVMTTGKAQITTEALAQWRADVTAEAESLGLTPREHGKAVLASGILILVSGDADHTDDVLEDLFPEEEEAAAE